ncbi:MAG: hypothetical protein MJY95_08410 [Bacteroidaceae bacterium]|nr:hypothetical protein [Bacteroidaceae bacterium]
MIRNDGVATIKRGVNIASLGDMPRMEYTDIFQSYYGEKTVGINRYWSAMSNNASADYMVEITRNGGISTSDICELLSFTDTNSSGTYRIIQVQHLQDEDGLPVTDLTLERIGGIDT